MVAQIEGKVAIVGLDSNEAYVVFQVVDEGGVFDDGFLHSAEAQNAVELHLAKYLYRRDSYIFAFFDDADDELVLDTIEVQANTVLEEDAHDVARGELYVDFVAYFSLGDNINYIR